MLSCVLTPTLSTLPAKYCRQLIVAGFIKEADGPLEVNPPPVAGNCGRERRTTPDGGDEGKPSAGM